MEYIVVKDADKIVNRSPYVVTNPTTYIGKWSSLFNNNNPIKIEIGMGRGDLKWLKNILMLTLLVLKLIHPKW